MLACSQGNRFIYNGGKQNPKADNALGPERGTGGNNKIILTSCFLLSLDTLELLYF